MILAKKKKEIKTRQNEKKTKRNKTENKTKRNKTKTKQIKKPYNMQSSENCLL